MMQNRPELAKAETAGAHDLDFVGKARAGDFFLKFVNQLAGTGGCATGAAADQNV